MTKDISPPTTGGTTPSEETPKPMPPHRKWMVAHACPACTYTHRIALDAQPSAGARYAYTCPYSGKEVSFGAPDVTHVVGPAQVGTVTARRLADA